MATTTKGFPYPEGPDPVDVAGDVQLLAESVDAAPGVQSYTGAQIAALAIGQKWAGRIVWNSTTSKLQVSDGANFADVVAIPAAATVLAVAASDETTALTTGAAKVTFRMPYAMTLTGVRSSLTTVSSSGLVTVGINEGGVSILGTDLSIDANELTSTTAATPATITDTALADDAQITIDIDAAGTGAKGLKVYLIGTRA